jgi:hypothetical protein
MTDDSLMPFGKYKGKKMIDVPARYLLWLNDQPYIDSPANRAVRAYIADNMDVLKAQEGERKRDYMFNPYR